MSFPTNKIAIASLQTFLNYIDEVQHPLSSLSNCEKSRLSIQTLHQLFNYLSTNCMHNTSILSYKKIVHSVTRKIISLLLQLSSGRKYFCGKLKLVSLELVNSISKLVQNATIASIPEFIDSEFVSEYLSCMRLIEDAKVRSNIFGSIIVSGKRCSTRLQKV